MELKNKWSWGYLGALIIFLFFEFIAIFDKNPNTLTLTNWVISNVPIWITMPVISVFGIWLFIHFKKYYEKQKNFNKRRK